jgi:hypothetical protein
VCDRDHCAIRPEIATEAAPVNKSTSQNVYLRLNYRMASKSEEGPNSLCQSLSRGPPARELIRMSQVVDYLVSLFPIIGWIPRYSELLSHFMVCLLRSSDLGWAYGDFVAGLTVGIVLVPQGMSYAQIATLPTQYGLYSSFVGVLVYCVCSFPSVILV